MTPLPGIHNERVPRTVARIPDVRSWSIREYGNRVGVWRMFEVLTRFGIRATAALNSDVCDFHHEIVVNALESRCELDEWRTTAVRGTRRAGHG